MIHIFYAVLPIFFLIMTGLGLKRIFITEDSFWKQCDKLVYYVLFPSLLILKLSHADFYALNTASALVALIIATLIMTIALVAYQAIKPVSNKLFTSIYQGSIRYNSYVFLAMSASLFGDNGIAVTAIIIAYMIVICNLLSVFILSVYGSTRASLVSITVSILKNPLILAAILGVLLSISKLHIHPILEKFLTYLSAAALPLSLLSVGAGLKFILGKSRWFAVSSTCVLKLIALPLISWVVLTLFNVDGYTKSVAMLYATLPCAGNAYILAKQMGGDAEAMASIITFTTLLSMITMPVMLSIMP